MSFSLKAKNGVLRFSVARSLSVQKPQRTPMTDFGNARDFTETNAENGFSIFCALGDSPLGHFLAAMDNKGNLRAVLFGDNDVELLDELRKNFPTEKILGGNRDYASNFLIYIIQLVVERPVSGANLQTLARGGDFARMIAAALKSTKPGSTITPEEVTLSIGASAESAQRVRDHAASDILAVVTPFHRLQEKDGTSPYYRWGEERRQALLAREAAGGGE
jgi:AraC family transcriptional regulator of adaptative response/methylated-DNA-[protein]-cysteine methyltransferase